MLEERGRRPRSVLPDGRAGASQGTSLPLGAAVPSLLRAPVKRGVREPPIFWTRGLVCLARLTVFTKAERAGTSPTLHALGAAHRVLGWGPKGEGCCPAISAWMLTC